MKLLPIALILFTANASLKADDEVISDTPGGFYTSTVTDSALSKPPLWEDLTVEPPLSQIDAIRLATRKLEPMRIYGDRIVWTPVCVSLVKQKSNGWYYVVTFRSKLNAETLSPRPTLSTGYHPDYTNKEIKLPVLLNGTIPEMIFHPYSEKTILLIKDLGL